MLQVRIPEYFQSITARVTYPSPIQENSGEKVFLLPGEGIVTSGRYEMVELSDNAVLIDELVKIHADIKSARPCASTWSGIHGVKPERLDLYAAFLAFCHLIWDEDVSQSEPMVYEYMRRSVITDNDTVHKVCWYYIDSLLYDKETVGFRLARSSPNAEELTISIHAENYYAALMTQLLLHIYKGKAGRDGTDIAVCRTCKRLYVRVRKNSRLCPDCASSTERSRSCRQRKREETRNAAKENNP